MIWKFLIFCLKISISTLQKVSFGIPMSNDYLVELLKFLNKESLNKVTFRQLRNWNEGKEDFYQTNIILQEFLGS